ncbi:endonuclease/exonuclease/phosphatase family protein [Pseudooceanicola sp.]|uniref:endonuclease/exonuclease/phosphatase family protein n=1 Tax=Pseudooceanicola sp. TaxID=1914328 RepID=UPI0035C758AF
MLKREDQIGTVVDTIAAARADVLVLADLDYDHGLATLTALRDAIGAGGGPDYPHLFAPRPNTGIDTGLDLNGDGEFGWAADAQGYGRFAGQGGLAVLSRFPLEPGPDHSTMLWRDIPGSLLIDHQGREGAKAIGAGVQRLSSTSHFELGVRTPSGQPLTMMIFHAGPPVFDGPEDRNGRRNHDEVLFWKHRLDGAFGPPPPAPVIIGAANLAPAGGDGRAPAINALLTDPRLTDPPALRGLPTVDWPDPGPGALRVDYILPSADLTLGAAKVMTADPKASRHALIWVEIEDHATAATRPAAGN